MMNIEEEIVPLSKLLRGETGNDAGGPELTEDGELSDTLENQGVGFQDTHNKPKRQEKIYGYNCEEAYKRLIAGELDKKEVESFIYNLKEQMYKPFRVPEGLLDEVVLEMVTLMNGKYAQDKNPLHRVAEWFGGRDRKNAQSKNDGKNVDGKGTANEEKLLFIHFQREIVERVQKKAEELRARMLEKVISQDFTSDSNALFTMTVAHLKKDDVYEKSEEVKINAYPFTGTRFLAEDEESIIDLTAISADEFFKILKELRSQKPPKYTRIILSLLPTMIETGNDRDLEYMDGGRVPGMFAFDEKSADDLHRFIVIDLTDPILGLHSTANRTSTYDVNVEFVRRLVVDSQNGSWELTNTSGKTKLVLSKDSITGKLVVLEENHPGSNREPIEYFVDKATVLKTNVDDTRVATPHNSSGSAYY